MIQFLLVLVLLDAAMFGGAPTPKLRRARVVEVRAATPCAPQPTPSPSCTADENGELTCYPIDDGGKRHGN
jgi:hypothetical protein